MDFQKVKDWVDLVLKVMSIVAIIAAGVWAYYQFEVTDTTESNIELVITTDVMDFSGNNKLLLIHVRPKNIGNVRVSPDHLKVIVRDLPLSLGLGEVDLDKQRELYSTDILDRYKDGYELEPNVTYDEVWTLIVPKGTMYSVRAEIDFDDGESEVDQTAVVKVE